MLIIFSHTIRLGIDLILLGIMLKLKIYEFTSTVEGLIFFRLSVGHIGRIYQYVISTGNHVTGFLTGIGANIIKTVLEVAILLNLYDDIDPDITAFVIIAILTRNIFEAVSLCERFSD